MPGTGDQVRLAKPVAYLDGIRRRGISGVVVVGAEQLFRPRQQQIASLHTIGLFAFDQAARAREPSGSAARLPHKQETETEPEGAARGACGLARGEIGTVGAIEGLEKFLIAADQIRRLCQQLEIVNAQRSLLVGPRERMKGIGPGFFLAVPAALGEFVGHRVRLFLCSVLFNVPHSLTPIPRKV